MYNIIKNSFVIHRSSNLRGLRRYLTMHPAKYVHLHAYEDNSALLEVMFYNGAFSNVPFADFSVLKDVVSRWKNLKGAAVIKHFVNRRNA